VSADVIWFAAVLAAAFALGFGIGRWRALALVVLVPLAFPLYEPDLDGAPRWFWPTLMIGPPVLIALVLGVTVRRAIGRRTQSPRREPGITSG